MFALSDPTLGDLDLDDETNGIILTDKNFGFPVVREVTHDYPDNHGAVDRTAYFGQRVISCSGYVVSRNGVSRADALQRLMSYCVPIARPTLSFQYDSNGTTYRAMLRIESQDAPITNSTNFKFNLTWKANPFFYGDDYSSVVGPNSTAVASQSLWTPPFFPLNFSAGAGASATLNNDGVVETWPVFKMFGEITDPSVTNNTTGKTLQFSGITISDTDYIIINTKERTAVLGSTVTTVAQKINYATSEWFPLATGDNSIVYDGSSPNNNAVMITTWNNLYL
jgi:hypothetical protein